MFEGTDLANRMTIEEMTASYEKAIKLVKLGYDTLDRAQQILESAFGNKYGRFNTVGRFPYDSGLENIELNLRRQAWTSIIGRLNIRSMMSIKAVEELDKKLDDVNKKNLAEITTQNVIDILLGYQQSSSDLIHDVVREVYTFLRPGDMKPHWNQEPLRTNQKNGKYDLGGKVILIGVLEHGYAGNFDVRGSSGDKLNQVDKLFHVMDGKSYNHNSYNSPLVTAIRTGVGEGETDYFKFKCCANRNLHLWFKRMDLVKLLNQYANDGTALKEGTWNPLG